MNLERQPSVRVSQIKYKTKMKKGQLEQLQAEIKSLNRKDVADLLLPTAASS
jgi:hypothetical protein